MIEVKKANYIVHGLQRGGNHAVINWILSHFNSSVFFNNCRIVDEKIILDNYDVVKNGKEPYDVTLISFEDKISEIKKINSYIEATNIFILRDFYNTYASRFEKKRNHPIISKNWVLYDDVNLWTELAEKFLDENNNVIKINYNKWFSDINYRINLSKNFGEFNDSEFKTVCEFGGGSSFDFMNYNGKANEMNVLNRWKQYVNNFEYRKKIFLNKKNGIINEKIFKFSFIDKFL